MANLDEVDAVAGELFGRLITAEARLDPYPVYTQLRDAAPVLDTGVGLVLVTGYSEVRSILRDPRLSSDESNSMFTKELARSPDPERPLHPSHDLDLMLFMDPPRHTRLRKLVARAFTPRRVSEIRPRIAAIVGELLDSATPGMPFDVIGDLAYPLATQVICELLGVPVADRERFGSWSADMAVAVDPSSIRSEQDNVRLGNATEAFIEYFTDLIGARRRDPGDDILSALIAAEEQGDRLSGEELLATGVLLLIAGHETTVNLIGNGIAALIADRAAMEAFTSNTAERSTAIDELIRIDSPVQLAQRITLDDTEIAERVIPEGTSLVLLLGAANHDPSVFADADRLRFDRTHSDHVGFGGGIHHCLGASLARTEGEVAITKLLQRFPDCELASEPIRRTTFTLRGYRELMIV